MVVPIFPFNQSIRFVPLNDIHYGSLTFQNKAFENTINYIEKNNKNSNPTYWSLDGDCIENIVKECVAGAYDQKITPTQQIEGLLEYLEPIKRSCLFIINGNHANRTKKTSYYDLMLMLSKRLSTKEHQIPYLGTGGYVRFQVGKQRYTIATQHGDSGCQNWELEIKRLRHNYPDADIYIMGHDHNLSYSYKPYIAINKEGCEEERYKIYCRSGNYLGFAEYARIKSYEMKIVGSMNMSFSADKFQITAYPMAYCNQELIPHNGGGRR
jgi:predicted phosphodiesterase